MNHLLRMSLCVLLMFICASCGKRKDQTKATGVSVRTMKPVIKEFQEVIATQGVAEPVDQAVLSALIPGKLEQLKVKEGDTIKRGQLLFVSDRKTLENRCTLAEEMLKMAKQRCLTRQADVNLAQVTFEKAKTDFHRSTNLYRGHAVSKDAYETAEVAYQKAKLTIDQANASLATARAEVSFAQVTLNIAKKRLADAECRAPYDGVVTAKLRHENEFCNAGTPVLKIENPVRKRITALVSGIHYSKIAVNQTRIEFSFGEKKLGCVPVTIVGRTIDPLSRTFELKADLPSGIRLPSGALCDIRIILSERKSLALPEDALLFNINSRFAVYTVRSGKAHLLQVYPGITQNKFTEILNADAVRDQEIIVSGQYFVEEGTQVSDTK